MKRSAARHPQADAPSATLSSAFVREQSCMKKIACRRKWLILSLCLGLAPAHAESPPFREPLVPGSIDGRFAIQARIHPGFGIQFHRKTLHHALAGTAGFLVLGLPGIAAAPWTKHAQQSPTRLSIDNLKRLAQFDDPAYGWSVLEPTLRQSVGTLPLVVAPAQIEPLEPRTEVLTKDLTRPVLVIDVYASLTASYRALHVSAIAYGLSPAKLAFDPLSNQTGRVYLNRFDYISDPLPAPAVLTRRERTERIRAIRDEYSGSLSKQQKLERKSELERVDGTLSPLGESAAMLLDTWTAHDAAKLREELRRGIEAISVLLLADLGDSSPTALPSADAGRFFEVMHDGGSRRIVRSLAEPFAGAVMSLPADVEQTPCLGIAFARELADHGAALCGRASMHPGAVCPPGYAYRESRCRRVTKTKSR